MGTNTPGTPAPFVGTGNVSPAVQLRQMNPKTNSMTPDCSGVLPVFHRLYVLNHLRYEWVTDHVWLFETNNADIIYLIELVRDFP